VSVRRLLAVTATCLALTACTASDSSVPPDPSPPPGTSEPSPADSGTPSPSPTASDGPVRPTTDLLDWQPVPGPVDEDVTRSSTFTVTETADHTTARITGAQSLELGSGGRVSVSTVLVDQELRLSWMRDQGFSVEAAVDIFVLLTGFVVGYCIEEQERQQAPDDRYSLVRRDTRVGVQEHPLVAAAGRRLFGDPDAHFEGLVRVLDPAVTWRTAFRSERGARN